MNLNAIQSYSSFVNFVTFCSIFPTFVPYPQALSSSTNENELVDKQKFIRHQQYLCESIPRGQLLVFRGLGLCQKP